MRTIAIIALFVLAACEPHFPSKPKPPIIDKWAITGIGYCTDNNLHTTMRFVNIRGDNVLEEKCGGPIDYDKDYK